MKNKAIYLLFLIISLGCSHRFSKPLSELKSTPQLEKVTKSRAMGKTRAIFHLIAPPKVELFLMQEGQNKEESITIDKTLSQMEMPHGYWEIVGFKLDHKMYRLYKLKKKFIFHLKKDKVSYVGSYILDCSYNKKNYFSDLKKMNFFNIYYFSSDNSLCEMVVGSDYKRINKVWKSLKSDNKSLQLGF
jgi:hypothetical protein